MLTAFMINAVVIALVVGLHYEFLRRLSGIMPHLPVAPRARILVGVFGALVAHVFEIWIMAAVYWFKIQADGFGHLAGEIGNGFWDCVYFSFITYTTVGYGDIYPIGLIRYLAGLESLIGLLLITWTASFLFVEMSRNWHR